MAKKTLDNIQVAGKRVLVRVDFNVPMKEAFSLKVSTFTRIESTGSIVWSYSLTMSVCLCALCFQEIIFIGSRPE